MENRTRIQDIVNKEGEIITVMGWVDTRRDHGKLIFIDLRDASGIVQVVFFAGNKDIYEVADKLRPEWVISVTGKIKKRPDNMINKDLPTGTIEVDATDIRVLNVAETLPFDITEDTFQIDELTRLKYRYLDLRSKRMQNNMHIRSDFVHRVRDFLFERKFIEIETPLLTQSTPEGSRDFVVPSRLHPGKFYALPQSPQQYKQLLMTAGFERYFQIARAVRDEDLRADRGFEHTQIDMELSFVDRDYVMNIVEEMIITVVEAMGYSIKQKPFPRISYTEAMKQYGDDKFDLRDEKEKAEGILAYAWVVEFPFFEKNNDGAWTFTHNPFSMPMPEYLENLMTGTHVEDILTSQYDLVCNGFESGGGSIRAHTPDILKATYAVMGYSDDEIQESIGHLLKAFSYGTPPHGGIALGIERNIMNLTGENYLREVQAFPMTRGGQTSVMSAPSSLTDKQLDELDIQLARTKKTE